MMIPTSSQLSFAFWTFAGFYLYWIWAENNSTFGFETIINQKRRTGHRNIMNILVKVNDQRTQLCGAEIHQKYVMRESLN